MTEIQIKSMDRLKKECTKEEIIEFFLSRSHLILMSVDGIEYDVNEFIFNKHDSELESKIEMHKKKMQLALERNDYEDYLKNSEQYTRYLTKHVKLWDSYLNRNSTGINNA